MRLLLCFFVMLPLVGMSQNAPSNHWQDNLLFVKFKNEIEVGSLKFENGSFAGPTNLTKHLNIISKGVRFQSFEKASKYPDESL